MVKPIKRTAFHPSGPPSGCLQVESGRHVVRADVPWGQSRLWAPTPNPNDHERVSVVVRIREGASQYGSTYECDAKSVHSTGRGVSYELVEQFLAEAEASDLLTESLTLEIKQMRSGSHIAEAVAGLANTDGGVVLVGVEDKDAIGVDRIVGVPADAYDRLVDHLRSLLPAPLPEVIAVAIPGIGRLIIVLRVSAESYLHPVLVGGKAVFRVPGATVPADRQRILDLIALDNQVPEATEFELWASVPSDPARLPLWSDGARVDAVVRVQGGLILPHRAMERP